MAAKCGCDVAVVQRLALSGKDYQDTVLHSDRCKYPELEALARELVAALEKSRDTIRVWNGMGMPKTAEKQAWDCYQSSPEMKSLNETLASAAALIGKGE